jgi:hypothetical protein
MPLILLEVRPLPKSVTAGFAGDCIVSQLAVDQCLTLVRDTGFEPVTPTVSRYKYTE